MWKVIAKSKIPNVACKEILHLFSLFIHLLSKHVLGSDYIRYYVWGENVNLVTSKRLKEVGKEYLERLVKIAQSR